MPPYVMARPGRIRIKLNFIVTVRISIGWFSNRTGTAVADGKASGKEQNTTSRAQFVAQPLVKPIVWFALVVVNWRSRFVAKSA